MTSKRMKVSLELVDNDKTYEVTEGLKLVKETAKAKFDDCGKRKKYGY